MADGNCDDALHELFEYLDGELTVERRADIQRHLDDCPPCYEAFEFEFLLWQRIRLKCQEQVPPSLRAKVTGSLDCEPPSGGSGIGNL